MQFTANKATNNENGNLHRDCDFGGGVVVGVK